jgi:16S rRNA (guanine527-N7)-methyltransferase
MEAHRIQELLAPFVESPLSGAQLDAVARYLGLLLRWNQRLNLTAIREPERIVTRHFGESFFAARKLYPEGAREGKLVDVGSGAGFPGLAIRIYAPVEVTLIESRQRKAAFLWEAARALGFRDVEVFNGRAEEYVAPATSASLTVTLRAVEKFEQALAAAASIRHAWRQERAQGLTAGELSWGRGRLALLIGAEQASRARETERAVAWADAVPIPQSRSRVLLVGESTL